jgi:hypothetical protein
VQRETISNLHYGAAEDMEQNQQEVDKQRVKLEQAGAFWSLVRAPKLGRRVYKNVWSEQMHRLAGFDESGGGPCEERGREVVPNKGATARTP